MPTIKLETFKPNNAKELADAIIGEAGRIVGAEAPKLAKALAPHVRSLAASTFRTINLLKEGKISQADADRATHDQEAYLNNILLLATFMTYVLAQKVLDGVMSLITAAIKNWTGVELNF